MKYKDFIDKEKHRKFKRDLAYEEWLMKFISQPSEHDINQMEKESINNSTYNPILGA